MGAMSKSDVALGLDCRLMELDRTDNLIVANEPLYQRSPVLNQSLPNDFLANINPFQLDVNGTCGSRSSPHELDLGMIVLLRPKSGWQSEARQERRLPCQRVTPPFATRPDDIVQLIEEASNAVAARDGWTRNNMNDPFFNARPSHNRHSRRKLIQCRTTRLRKCSFST